MHLLHTIFEWLEVIIDVSAALIMVLAFIMAMFSYLKISFRTSQGNYIQQLQLMRCDLGLKVVFALELLIISDLLHSTVSRTLDDLTIVGVLVVIRTVIGYFLNKEIAEISAQYPDLHSESNG